jgi:F-type H+-transporting ATPase subunit epsilon
LATFPLSIVSPRGKVLDRPVESLVVPGLEGEMGVLAQHAPMMAGLRPGVTKVHMDGKPHFFATGGGVLEVTRTEAILLVTAAEPAGDVNEAKELVKKFMEETRSARAAATSPTKEGKS